MPEEYRLLTQGAMALCAIMALVNALRFRSRGWAAFAMSGAFLVFGGLVYAIADGAAQGLIVALAVALALLLAADFILRAGRTPPVDR